MLFDETVHALEVSKSEVVLLDGSVGEAMVGDVLHEGGLHSCLVFIIIKNKFESKNIKECSIGVLTRLLSHSI